MTSFAFYPFSLFNKIDSAARRRFSVRFSQMNYLAERGSTALPETALKSYKITQSVEFLPNMGFLKIWHLRAR